MPGGGLPVRAGFPTGLGGSGVARGVGAGVSLAPGAASVVEGIFRRIEKRSLERSVW